MSLLAPWFLAGLAALAVPILAHLIRRATKDRVTFSAVRFLTPSAPRLDRRSRIQHPWLLLLRLLILALLALAFARPFFNTANPITPTAEPPHHVMAILDRSASMQRAGLWTAAKLRIQNLATELAPLDDFTLLVADDSGLPLITTETWRATAPDDRESLVAGLLDQLPAPGGSAFHLDDAVRAALERHQELSAADQTQPSAPVLHVVSDLARGTRVSGLASIAWPDGLELHLDRVDPDASASTSNIALQWLGWGIATSEQPSPPARVRLVAGYDTPTTSVQLTLLDPSTNTPLSAPTTQVVARGGATTVLLPVPENAPDALSIRLEGDAVPFDNQLWVVRPAERALPTVLLGSTNADDPADPAYYLTRALAGWRDPVPTLTDQLPPLADPTTSASLPPFILAPSPPADALLPAIRAQVEAGATAVFLLDSPAAATQAARLLDEPAWGFADAATTSSGYALFGQIDFTHPLFLPFADPRYSDFSRIRFWSRPHLTLPPNSTAVVAARFDDGSPAVLEASLGRGRIVWWTGGWTPTSSQWVLSSKFVPWLQALAERTAGGTLRASVSELDQLDRLGPYASLTSLDPDLPRTAPGLYQLRRDNLPPRTVALNVPSSESDLPPLDLDVFAQLGAPLAGADRVATPLDAAQQRTEAAYLTESRQKLWRWLLLAAALLLAAESFFSLRIARRATALN
ncbi:BatA domain-containing protein [Actomonas aquatica]|uniref:BatA domain-containing protein n=1 Tax=Actomonas aquatica TaxID=2866162 RepID=A0ABZ1C919_9BACT|nr:BatA domain-containing protein [Opitutus sp. WL0086]WRQ87996.1 BatA domain-containing protein [Opitutus sp. WL0086]